MMNHFLEIRDWIFSNPKKFLIGLALGLLALSFIFGDYGLIKRISMEVENRQLEKRLAEEEQKIVEQQAVIKHAYSPDSVEKVARERYNFHKDDETVFTIKDE
ncbi:Septum formation initiator [Chlorobaculum parvum NCIB 8327]|uniref:Septum formation initiator n=1 Tax=Chlorobaculum parvum (strain DSM 263 / NCIMB 8327) TaxID=517417 RepID=B3QQT1_CHLP8|nr:septum formation initiator family protein [Chlorobaculum parvum]ACF12284.1 Septum formation initiator [Chlorobaculum parvum NCIB 8327]